VLFVYTMEVNGVQNNIHHEPNVRCALSFRVWLSSCDPRAPVWNDTWTTAAEEALNLC